MYRTAQCIPTSPSGGGDNYIFVPRTVNIWNSLPDFVVIVESVICQNHLDMFGSNKSLAELARIGNRSEFIFESRY